MIDIEVIDTVDPGGGIDNLHREERNNSQLSHGKFKRFLTYISCMLEVQTLPTWSWVGLDKGLPIMHHDIPTMHFFVDCLCVDHWLAMWMKRQSPLLILGGGLTNNWHREDQQSTFACKRQLPFHVERGLPFHMERQSPFHTGEMITFSCAEAIAFCVQRRSPFHAQRQLPFHVKRQLPFHVQRQMPFHTKVDCWSSLHLLWSLICPLHDQQCWSPLHQSPLCQLPLCQLLICPWINSVNCLYVNCWSTPIPRINRGDCLSHAEAIAFSRGGGSWLLILSVVIVNLPNTINRQRWLSDFEQKLVSTLGCLVSQRTFLWESPTNMPKGQTLQFVGIYLPDHMFTHGQLYVAFSRVTDPSAFVVCLNNPDGFTRNIVSGCFGKVQLICQKDKHYNLWAFTYQIICSPMANCMLLSAELQTHQHLLCAWITQMDLQETLFQDVLWLSMYTLTRTMRSGH